MSLRASSSRPTTCSGDMYPSLPLSCPASVRRSISAARAMPKSVSFTAPERSMSTLPGDTSRCTSASGLPVFVARGVGVLERAQDGERDVQAHVERQLLALRGGGADEARARRAVDVLHRHVELAVLLAEVEHLDDVRVAEAGADARLVDEHRDEVRVAGELRQDALDRDDLLEAVRPGAPRQVDLRHPARRDPLEAARTGPGASGAGMVEMVMPLQQAYHDWRDVTLRELVLRQDIRPADASRRSHARSHRSGARRLGAPPSGRGARRRRDGRGGVPRQQPRRARSRRTTADRAHRRHRHKPAADRRRKDARRTTSTSLSPRRRRGSPRSSPPSASTRSSHLAFLVVADARHGLGARARERRDDARTVAARHAQVRKLVLWSQTWLYGAHPSNPNFLTEKHPLRAPPERAVLRRQDRGRGAGAQARPAVAGRGRHDPSHGAHPRAHGAQRVHALPRAQARARR